MTGGTTAGTGGTAAVSTDGGKTEEIPLFKVSIGTGETLRFQSSSIFSAGMIVGAGVDDVAYGNTSSRNTTSQEMTNSSRSISYTL